MNTKYLIILLGILLILSTSCGDKKGKEKPTPPTPIVTLKASTIIKPQQDAVCQGEKQSNGKYKVKVSCTPQDGVNYVFKLWDSKGQLVETINSSNSPNNTFTKAESGKRYTVSVIVSKSGKTKESTKVAFSTPGIQVENYIPIVKTAVYDATKSTLTLVFHDPDKEDKELFYSLYTAPTIAFAKANKLKENIKAAKNKSITITEFSIKKGTFLKIIVKDTLGNESFYIIYKD